MENSVLRQNQGAESPILTFPRLNVYGKGLGWGHSQNKGPRAGW
jgi:hypothetical protein